MKKILLIAIAFFSLGAVANADTFGVFGSRAAQNPTDILDWSQLGPAFTQLGTPQLVSTFEGNPALVGNINGSDFLRVDEGNGWVGNFDYGESLVWTGNSNFGVGGLGPFAIVLGNPVGSFGFTIQADLYGPFTATVEALDVHGNPLFSYTASGVSNGLENGSALFIGLGDRTGVNIGVVEISTNSGSGNPAWANDFAIDDPSFTYTTATPEPGSILLLGSGLLGMGGVLRRKLRTKLHPTVTV